MEQLVIVLIIGAVSLIRWVMEKSAEARAERAAAEQRENPNVREVAPAPRPAHPMQAPRPIAVPLPDPTAAARGLREALGLPDEAQLPPPVVVERKTPPPAKRPVILFERPLPEFTPRSSPPPLVIVEEGPAPIPLPPVAPPGPAPAPKAARSSGLEELLRSREGLRKAILAQEILGTPKGLVF